jgi:TolA-binding protein
MDFSLSAMARVGLQSLPMVRLSRWLLILLPLFFSGGRLLAASSAENRAFNAASNAFKLESWAYAERSFGDFVRRFPKSQRVAEAILFQGEARFQLHQYDGAIVLLSTNQARAGTWGDEYLYWMAQAQVLSTNYHEAAGTFARLVEAYPDSARRLEACVEEAAAFAKLEEWPRVIELLQQTSGVFQQTVRAGPASEWTAHGFLLLGEAHLAQKNSSEAEGALQSLNSQTLSGGLEWRRQYLQCRLQVADGQLMEALAGTTNLIALADTEDRRSESVAFKAGVLERLNRFDEAIAAYKANLGPDISADRQREALLKITDLSLAQTNSAEAITNAITNLDHYVSDFPESPAADVALLTLGELQLKQYAASLATNSAGPATNVLPQALARLDSLLNSFPNSPFAGKALLDKGWCLWTEGFDTRSAATNTIAESEEAFRLAAQRLPLSEDQAMARFKWADAQFVLKDFAGAITNYSFIGGNYDAVPEVKARLLEPALYQTVRTALEDGDMNSATSALQKILDLFPDGFAGDRCLFLSGEGFARRQDTARARELFADFERRFPGSPLLPEVRLAVARTYEQEKKWMEAIGNYNGWISTFTNGSALPQAEFCRARDNYMAGQQANALMLFTNFVAQFRTNELAPQAQWWIGDYYFNLGDFLSAEKNYQLLFQNWPKSELAYQARMQAGRAAVARQNFTDAIFYFTNLTLNPDCPPRLQVQATFAYGDALVSQVSTNKTADWNDAIGVFNHILLNYGTNEHTVPAWGMIGKCYLQLAARDPAKYDDAVTNYQRLIESPHADIAARSQAAVGLGIIAEKQAEQKNGTGQNARDLYARALNNYMDVLVGNNLRDGETRNPYWVKEAGLGAARMAEKLQDWTQAVKIYKRLDELLPVYHATWESKQLKAEEQKRQAQEHQPHEKN